MNQFDCKPLDCVFALFWTTAATALILAFAYLTS